MRRRLLGRVAQLTPVKAALARIEGGPPRLGSRVEVGGVRGRVIDIIGNVEAPYAVIKVEDPGRVKVGDEVYLIERRRGRTRGRRRGKNRLPRRPDNRKRGRKKGVQG